MKSEELRKKFADFFSTNAHKQISSSSLIPQNDPTVLLTTAGMQQLVPYFFGKKHSKGNKLFSIQKCFRTPDIEEIGDDTHHTFFEMLGNWSLGDYFKNGAIDLAYDFFVDELKLDPKKFAITIFKGNKEISKDEEAENFWKEKGIKEDQIFEFDEKDNFWGPTGKTGPCGPCSEIHYDRGEKYGCKENCGPNCEKCERFVEIWNLVFMEYEKKSDGTFAKLNQKNVDTGVGFERLVSLLQDKDSSYETDIFSQIIEKIEKLSGKNYSENKKSFRIIADHTRGSVFLISDGVDPSNEGRGYILRRIIRRAILKAKNLGIKKDDLKEIINSVINRYKIHYPELEKGKDVIIKKFFRESDAFQKTLERGEKLLLEILDEKPKIINGEQVFKLFDTYGFPLEITKEIAEEKGIKIDEKGFKKQMEKQKLRSKEGAKSMFELEEEFLEFPKTLFSGYEEESRETEILESKFFEKDGGHFVKLILKTTPFYAESGGQISDIGFIEGKNGKVKVIDVQENKNGTFIHTGEIVQGEIKKKEKVIAKIDSDFRNEIKKHHTAAHILHSVLRELFGNEVSQKGSWIGNKRGRFDFSFPRKIEDQNLRDIEEKVNQIIEKNICLETKTLLKEDAISKGALAFFGDKYDEDVRMVQIDKYSKELCGGTHAENTGDIGIFLIEKESSIAAGIRRIEFICGGASREKLLKSRKILNSLSAILNSKSDEIEKEVKKLVGENKDLKKELEKISESQIQIKLDEIFQKSDKKNIKGEIVTKDLKKAAFYLKNKGAKEITLINPKEKTFVILSDSGKAKEVFSDLKGVKGGGNEKFYTGKIFS